MLAMLLAGSLSAVGQTTTTIQGRVLDAKTGDPVPFVNIALLGSSKGTATDINGNYSLTTSTVSGTVVFSCIGYNPETKEIPAGSASPILISVRLRPQTKSLEQVTVRGKRIKYRNRDNPAVELIRRVIAHKDQNRPESFETYQYNKYEKMQFDLSNISEKFRNRKSLRKFDFVFQYTDTSATGRVNLPIYLHETISDVYYRQKPERRKEIIDGDRISNLGFAQQNSMKVYIESLYQNINIYDNNVLLLGQQFLSPLAPVSPQFYQFVIVDSVQIDGVRCVNLGFSPRNQTDLLFQGTISIALDSSYAVRKVEMGFAKDINVNFVTDLRVNQVFKPVANGKLVLTTDQLAIEFNLLKKENSMGLFGQRSLSFSDYKINQPIDDKVFAGLRDEVTPTAATQSESYWQSRRHQPLSRKEQGVYTLVDSVRNVPLFRKAVNTTLFLLEGYKPIGPFEIGPVSTFYSYNPIEGFRLRLGGRTTPAFSERVAVETYGAYGFGDQRFKAFAAVTLSLTNHNVYTYPIKHLRFSYQNDTRIPGQTLQFVQESNVLLSIKRNQSLNRRMTYDEVFMLDYLNESQNGLSVNVNLKRWKQTPAGVLRFEQITPVDVSPVPDLTTTELTVGLRYAPGEKFIQGKTYRIPIINKHPTFSLRYTAGLSGVLGGEYGYSRLVGHARKRFYLGPLGYADGLLEGGTVFGKAPFPLLFIHRANQTYGYQIESFNQMNFMEFISDQYGSAFVDYHLNGFIFNKLPLLKKLKWREIFTIKGIYGTITDSNLPTASNGLYALPTDPDGQPISHALNQGVYAEASVGVDNIFRVLRLDLVKRLSYQDLPNASNKVGLRFLIKFDF